MTVTFSPPRPGMNTDRSLPFALVDFLVKHHNIKLTDPQNVKIFTRLKETLETSVHDGNSRSIATIAVPQSIQNVLATLRSCPMNDIMTFACSDGVKINAHKSVLSMYSQVFEMYFDGPWSKTHPDGQWETAYPSHLINFLLDYMYTGKIDFSYISGNHDVVYTAAHEFQLMILIQSARNYVIDAIDRDSIKRTMDMAYMHDDNILLDDCFEYVNDNMEDVVMPEPAFAALSLEQPDLWEGLFRYLRPGKPYVKYDPEGSSRKKRASEGGEEQEGGKKARQSESTAVGCRTGEASPEKA
jgi:BTB/POZ domain